MYEINLLPGMLCDLQCAIALFFIFTLQSSQELRVCVYSLASTANLLVVGQVSLLYI